MSLWNLWQVHPPTTRGEVLTQLERGQITVDQAVEKLRSMHVNAHLKFSERRIA